MTAVGRPVLNLNHRIRFSARDHVGTPGLRRFFGQNADHFVQQAGIREWPGDRIEACRAHFFQKGDAVDRDRRLGPVGHDAPQDERQDDLHATASRLNRGHYIKQFLAADLKLQYIVQYSDTIGFVV